MELSNMPKSFSDYETDYKKYIDRVRYHLASSRSLRSLSECDKLLDKAKQCAHAMQGLAEISDDKMNNQKAKHYLEREIHPLYQEVAKSMAEIRNNPNVYTKEELLFSGRGQQLRGGVNENETEKIMRESERLLMDSQMLCADSEAIGNSVLGQMGSQREQLQNAHGYIHGTMKYTQEAGQQLKDMSRRAVKNKIFLYCIIALLLAANGYVIWRILN